MMEKSVESLLTLDEIIEATGGIHVMGQVDGENGFCFTSVHTDSRDIVEKSLFVPLVGEFQDGHRYIPQAAEKGASVVFIRMSNYEKDGEFFKNISLEYPDIVFIAVENTMLALQNAAARYVEKFPHLMRVGITGSSGKTTTKEILVSILSQKYSVVSNPGNLNSETGLPLSVFGIRKEHQVGVFEMGMNRHNEMGEISAVLKPRFAIITNIGTAHIGNLGNRENIAIEKGKIFDHFHGFGTAVIPKNDDFADFLADNVEGKVVFYGDGEDPSVKFVADLGLDGTEFSVDGKKCVLPLPGKYNFGNALGAIALAKVLGLDSESIVKGIQSMKPMFGRSQVIKGKYTVVQDCYNANPDSMEKSIDFISSVTCRPGQKKILVLGDMLELGESSADEHRKAGLQAAGAGASMVVFVGHEMKNALDSFREKNSSAVSLHFEGHSDSDIESAVDEIRKNAGEGDIVLIKASRGMGLERVTERLLEEN